MADTAAQVADVARLLREWGYDVREVAGWQDRGRGSMTTRGRIEHHTAGGSGNAPSLRVVVYGRSGLRNSLSRYYVARDGTIYLVARRKSWHAGSGSKGTNGTLSGTEAEHSGDPGESWSQASLAAQAAISAAECAVFGIDPGDVWDHREHAPSRKPDRVNVDSHGWRDRVRRVLDGTDTDSEEDLMAQFGPPLTLAKSDRGKWYLIHEWDQTYSYVRTEEALSKLLDRAKRDDHPFIVLREAAWQEDWFAGMAQMDDRE